MNKLKFLIALLAIIFAFSGCNSCNQKQQKNKKEEIKIGAVFDATGSLSYMGKWSQEGALLAVDDINKSGGIDGRQIKLIIEDGGTDANKTVSAFQKLINDDKVNIAIGFNSSSGLMAAAPVANSKKVVILSSGAASPSVTDAGDFIFRNRLSGKLEVEAMAKFIANEKNQKEVGIIYINNDYGKGFEKIFHSMFEAAGGKVLLEEGYEQNQTDFKSLVKKFKDKKIKIVYLISFAKEGGNLLKQSYEQNFMPNWYSSNAIEGPEFIEIGGKATEGLIYSVAKYDAKDSLSLKFNNEYNSKYGYNSEMFAANAYDAIKIAAMSVTKTDGNGDQIKTYLYDSIKNYPGVAGLTAFDKNGDVEKPVMFKTIKDGKFISYNK
jgi:branched-chain amino acid transport system substrate-binding protein